MPRFSRHSETPAEARRYVGRALRPTPSCLSATHSTATPPRPPFRSASLHSKAATHSAAYAPFTRLCSRVGGQWPTMWAGTCSAATFHGRRCSSTPQSAPAHDSPSGYRAHPIRPCTDPQVWRRYVIGEYSDNPEVDFDACGCEYPPGWQSFPAEDGQMSLFDEAYQFDPGDQVPVFWQPSDETAGTTFSRANLRQVLTLNKKPRSDVFRLTAPTLRGHRVGRTGSRVAASAATIATTCPAG